MKIEGVPGQFWFRALVNGIPTERFFRTREEVAETLPPGWIWPIEILDNGTIYVPTKEELE